jgi:glutathione S-transferase
VLLTGEGIFDDSTKILSWADAKATHGRKLFPQNVETRIQIEEFEDDLDEDFGVAGRLWMYTHMLTELPLIIQYSKAHGVPWYERMLMPLVFPRMKNLLRKYLRMKSTSRKDSQSKVNAVFEEVAKRLADGRSFLFGDQFTAADLTFASLAAAVLLPEHYGVPLPKLSELPAEMAEQVRVWRAHPAGQFALRIYQNFRR